MDRQKLKRSISQIMEIQHMLWQLDRVLFLALAAGAVTEAVQPFVGIYLSAYVLDGLSQRKRIDTLLLTAVLAVGGSFLLTLFRAWLEKLIQVRRYTCVQYFERQWVTRTLTMDYELLESPAINAIRNRMNSDRNWGAGFLSVILELPVLYRSLLSVFLSTAVLLPLFLDGSLFSDVLSLGVLAVFAGVIIFNCSFGSKKRRKLEQLLTGITERVRWIGFFLWKKHFYRQGMDIRIFGGQGVINWYMDRDLNTILNYQKKIIRSESERGFGAGLASGLLQLTAYLFVALRAVAGGLSAGSVVKYASTVYRFANSVSELLQSLTENSIVAQRQQSTVDYMNIKDVLYKGTLPVEKRDDNSYEIEFHHVSFRYPGTEGYALKDLNFKFTIGERLAVVGMNGSGKTTMIKLLCRLYDPTEGTITLNGIDIKKYDYAEYMRIFSVVFQDFKLFAFTLGQNVAVSVDYDRGKAREALIKAGFGKRLAQMPEGLNTSLYQDYEKNGVEISGGEAQKIALARALYKDAPFIILDEPTAALDPVAEYEIYSRFNEIVGEKTAIYISHRLSSCRFCSDIAVFDKGRLVQRGSHDSLVADEKGKYYELWNAQAQYYT